MASGKDDVEIRRRLTTSSSNEEDNENKKNTDGQVQLSKQIGPLSGISLVVGTMIGSGIFMSPSSVTSYAGSVGASLCVWAGCGVLATMCAFTYMELGLMIRKSGGEYQYLKEAYGDAMAFLLSWTFILISKPSEFAIISLSFAEYVIAPFYPGCSPPTTVLKCAAAFCILIITFVNAVSVRASQAVQIFFTAAKLLLIFAIIIGGFVEIGYGNTQYLDNAFEGTSASASSIALAFYYGLWSYDGWNTLNFVTEELKNPVRNFPLTIVFGIPLVTVCYVLVNVAYFTVMSPAELIASNAVAVTFGDRVFGSFSWTVPLAVACSTFGAANGLAFTTARLTYASGRNGHMLESLSYISVTRVSPVPALIFNSLIGMLMLLPDSSNFETLINYFTFATWIFYGATFFSVIVLRRKRPGWERPYKVWIVVPLLCTVASIYLIIAPIVENPSLAYLYAGLFILLGLVVYFPLIYYNKQPAFMGPVTSYIQQILEVVPPPDED